MTASPEIRGGGGRLPIVPFLEIVARRRRMVIALAVAAGLIAGIMGFIIPTTYETTLTIMPPDQSSPLGGMGGGIQSTLAMLQVGFATIATSDLYADMIRSRSVLKYAIDKLDLISAFGITEKDSLKANTFALQQLQGDVAVSTANNGLITITVQAHTGYFPDKTAKAAAQRRVAAIGNALAEGLDKVNREKNTSRARQTRIYLEQQVAATSAQMEKASADLSQFQSSHLAIDVSEQMKAGIEAAGTLQGQLLAREIALGVALQSMRPNNPEVQALQSEVAELRKKLHGFQFGDSEAGVSKDPLDVGLDKMPELGRVYAGFLREVKIQETVFELLTEQLYRARIQETQDVPVVQLLDSATVPAFKKSPVIRKIGFVAGLMGLLLGIFIAYAAEWWERYPGRDADAQGLRNILGRR
jgi:tyrosine-protein kinase Etk/Wzc